MYDLSTLRTMVDDGSVIEVVAENPSLITELLDKAESGISIVTELPEDIKELLLLVDKIDEESRSEVVQNIPKLVIQDDDQRKHWCEETLPRVLGWQKYADEERRRLKDPFLRGGQQVDDLFRSALFLLATLVERIKGADRAYRAKIDAEAKAAAAAEQKRIEAERLKSANADAAKLETQGRPQEAQALLSLAKNTPPAPIVAPKAAAPKGSSIRKRWKYEITDPMKVPRDFCEPSDRLIKARVDTFGDKAEIEGVRVYLDEDIATKAIMPNGRK